MLSYESDPESVVVNEDEQIVEIDLESESTLAAEAENDLASDFEIQVQSDIEKTAGIDIDSENQIQAEPNSDVIDINKPIEELAEKEVITEVIDKIEARFAEFQFQVEPELEARLEFDHDTKQIVEAILFAAEKPMTAKQVRKVYPEIERPKLQAVQAAIDSIIEDYASRSIGLKSLASGYRFQVKEGYSYWVSRLFEDKPPRYSRALLETLSIIAYRQPVTRGDIEDIRGVSVSSNIIRSLLEREWIRVIALKEVPGRPALYGTNKQFLDYFNLSSLDQLPTLEEIKDFDFSSETFEKTDDPENSNEENANEENANEEQSSEE